MISNLNNNPHPYMSLKRTIALTLTGSALLGSLIVAVPVFADTTTTTAPSAAHAGGMHWGGGMSPGVFGTVTAVSGNSITLTSKGMMMRGKPGSTTSTAPAPTPTTYTVDASGATVTKNNAASSVSAIAVGDTLMVQGTVSGTSVTAKTIRDLPAGKAGGMSTMRGGQGGPNGGASGSPIQGNGEPVIGGSITAISGSTLTVNAKAGVNYSVDASSAVVKKGNATSTVSSITVGDNVVVQGTVNGTSVVASSVMDSGAPKTSTSGTAKGGMGGFMGAIGGFFQHLFGFF